MKTATTKDSNRSQHSGEGASAAPPLLAPFTNLPDWRATIGLGTTRVALPFRLYAQYLSLPRTQRLALKAQIKRDFQRLLKPVEFVEPTQTEADLYAQSQLSRTAPPC